MSDMSNVGQVERMTQDRVVKLFGDRLGYGYLGNLQDREGNSNVEVQPLELNLEARRYGAIHIGKAVDQLWKEASLGGGRDLYEANQDVYRLLRYGVKVKPEAGHVTETVWLIDWEHPERNHFGVAEEVTVAGQHTKRPDLVLYINGIAVCTIELKRSKVAVSEGIRQTIGNQTAHFIRPFFTTVQLVMAGNDVEGLRYAVIDTPEKYWLKWRLTSDIDSKTRAQVDSDSAGVEEWLDQALAQMCAKPRLLEIIHDFMVFDAGVKKTCRPNQYFGVKAAQERVRRREGGIIWHAQGSGKSLLRMLERRAQAGLGEAGLLPGSGRERRERPHGHRQGRALDAQAVGPARQGSAARRSSLATPNLTGASRRSRWTVSPSGSRSRFTSTVNPASSPTARALALTATVAKSRRPASARDSNCTPSTVMAKRSPRVSTRRAMASSHCRTTASNRNLVVAAAASTRTRRAWSSWCARRSRDSRATSLSTLAFSMSRGLPVASALTSAKESACSPMSSISRPTRLPRITWWMNAAFRSTVCLLRTFAGAVNRGQHRDPELSLWPADADEALGDHDPATGQFVEVVVLRKPLKHGHDIVRLLVAEAQQDHAEMAAGWVGAGIAKSEVEGDQSSLVCDGSGEHVGIGSAGQLLVGNGIDVVAESEKRILGDDSDVLVELEPHVVGESGRISCLASQAP